MRGPEYAMFVLATTLFFCVLWPVLFWLVDRIGEKK